MGTTAGYLRKDSIVKGSRIDMSGRAALMVELGAGALVVVDEVGLPSVWRWCY